MAKKNIRVKLASRQQIERFSEELGVALVDAMRAREEENYLTDPLSAFLLAWDVEHGEGMVGGLESRFRKLLLTKCDPNFGFSLTGDRGSAMTTYLDTIQALLRVWRTEQPISRAYGSRAAHWCAQHPTELKSIQEAMRLRSPYLRVEKGTWETWDWRPNGPAHQPANKNLVLSKLERFVQQRTWNEAAQTAGYALFGDFLAGVPDEIGFCRVCEKPFLRGKKNFSCSVKCAHVYSATASRHDAKALRWRRGLRKAARNLAMRLQKPHSAGSDWRKLVERDFGLRSRDGRYSRLMGEYIRASQTPSGSPEREKIVRSLLSCCTDDPKERNNVQLQLEGFLADLDKVAKGLRK